VYSLNEMWDVIAECEQLGYVATSNLGYIIPILQDAKKSKVTGWMSVD